MKEKHSNHLVSETSPYLLQHAHNPVDWYPWGREALDRAKAEGKPILVSIGYSSCHWCHVMERESFEDEQVAQYMNEHFINIKVDREERPDIDQLYMEAVQTVTGSGGWPLNCFLTPDTKPFYGGTYFPPDNRYGKPSWLQVLQQIKAAYHDRAEIVEDQANRLLKQIQHSNRAFWVKIDNVESDAFEKKLTDDIYENLVSKLDLEFGGFGSAPKFPNSMALIYLLRYAELKGDPELAKPVYFSLNKMIDAGIYDQLGGGFARYATDQAWNIPHFEKMLYDNALLLVLLAEAYQKSQNKDYARVIKETIAYTNREMLAPDGGFYAALDADSEGVEGKFYVWTKEEIDSVLGEDADLFNNFYDVQAEGNWEGHTILRRTQALSEYASVLGLEEEIVEEKLSNSIKRLMDVRETRVRPGLDDKIILSWNALMCKAYAKVYQALGDSTYKEQALKQIHFLLDTFKDGEGLKHTYKNGELKHDAFLDDYAFLIEALIEIYFISFDIQFLELATRYIKYCLEAFLDQEQDCFWYTASESALIVRKKDVFDGSVPSGNSTMALNLQKMGLLLDKEEYKALAKKMFVRIKEAAGQFGTSFPRWASGILFEAYPRKELVLVGAEAFELAAELNREYIPGRIIMATKEENNNFPLLAGKVIDNETMIYMCSNYHCQKPVKTIKELKEQFI